MKIYNGDEVQFVFGPVIILGGRGDDEFVKITKLQPLTDYLEGVDGEVALSRIKSATHEIVLTLMQTSIHNDELSVLANLVQTAPAMAGAIHPLTIKDPNGRALYKGSNAVIMEVPEVSYAKKPTNREWKFFVSDLKRVDGGNNSA